MPTAGNRRAIAVSRVDHPIAAPFLQAAARAKSILGAFLFLSGWLFVCVDALAADNVRLTRTDHRFDQTEVIVPAGERFRIEVENKDATPAEFESSDLRIEKIVVPGGKITVWAGPLKPGRYRFFDDYHPDSAQGTIIVVEKKPGE